MAEMADNKVGNDAVPDMKALMTEIAKALVDEPEAVAVEAIAEGDSTLLQSPGRPRRYRQSHRQARPDGALTAHHPRRSQHEVPSSLRSRYRRSRR